MPRFITWFSCGIASAVAAKIAPSLFPDFDHVIVNCDTRPSEHPSNYQFTEDCSRWFSQPVIHIHSEVYGTVDEVFEKTRYMAGVYGARCTTELKKLPRHAFAQSGDFHAFGFTADKKERKRAQSFQQNNPELNLRWPLIEAGLTKADCRKLIEEAGIQVPAMYTLGFDNNNCPGCVKASSPWYWDMVRQHFPDVFRRRCEQSRALGVRLVEIHHHDRIFLDELPAGPFRKNRKRENMSCGPECGAVKP